jgi:hypothetical protein
LVYSLIWKKKKYDLKTGILKKFGLSKESLGLTRQLTLDFAEENRQLEPF